MILESKLLFAKVIGTPFIYTLLLLFVFPSHSNAQAFHVYGVVSDSSGNPVQGAVLQIMGTAFSDTSDANGAYDIKSGTISVGGTASHNIPNIHLQGSNLRFTLSGPGRTEIRWFNLSGTLLARTQMEYNQSGSYSLPLVAPDAGPQMVILQARIASTQKSFKVVRGESYLTIGRNFSDIHLNSDTKQGNPGIEPLDKNAFAATDTLTAFVRGNRFEKIPLTSDESEINITLTPVGTHSWASWPMPNPAGTGLPNPAQYTDLGDGTVRDEVTGLIWQKEAAARTYNYEEALDYCPTLGSGWRLPKRIELTSLFDFTRTSPAIHKETFPTVSNFFSTSSPWILTVTDASRPRYAWVMNFYEGIASNAGAMETPRYVRCVKGYGDINRPASAPENQYTEVAPGEIKDNYTGLTWQQGNSPAMLSSAEGNMYCDNLSLGGHNWRIPSIKELATLVDETKVVRALNTDVFPETAASEWYWSSSPWAGDASRSSSGFWGINFDDGFTGYNNFTTAWVKCVRVE